MRIIRTAAAGDDRLALERGPEWMSSPERACAPGKGVDPEIFYSPKRAAQDAAKKVCETCPFRAECADWADANGEFHGVWGGQVYSARKPHPRPDITSRVRALYADGLSDVEIAARLGRPRTSITAARNRLKLPALHRRGRAARWQAEELVAA
jgi:hypothetical protein